MQPHSDIAIELEVQISVRANEGYLILLRKKNGNFQQSMAIKHLPIRYTRNAALLKCHNIASEGSCLIRE